MPRPITSIKRYPLQTNETLQGWDSADELILSHIRSLNPENKRILILNDNFGALSAGLEELPIVTYTDSYVSAKAIAMNTEQKIKPLHDLSQIDGVFDFVLIRIPKNMSFFEDQLCHLTQHLNSGSKIICGSMVKHLAPTSFDLLNKYIGTTTTSLAEKKARLVFADFQKEKVTSPYPQSVLLDGFEKPFINHSNLFSREKLDIGSRFFLEHIPKGPYQKILDLGCANGVIGIKAKMQNPKARIVFSDESWMAIKSACENYKNLFQDEAEFYWTNCFEEHNSKNIDLVLCNPPFHQQNTIGDFIAWQMFKDSSEVLAKGGNLLVIGNSHLGYQIKMKKIFGNSRIVETNQKFMICESTRQ
ncbi:MAG: methyltransferase [Bdellovibrionota bacterium]